MVRPLPGTPNWDDDLNTDLDGIEAKAVAALEGAKSILLEYTVNPTLALAGVSSGRVVFMKPRTYSQEMVADGALALLKLDELAGNFMDTTANGRNFNVGTAVTRGRPALVPFGGYSVGSSGTSEIASYAGAHGITNATGFTMELWGKFPASALVKGSLIKFGATADGASIGVGDGSSNASAGRIFTYSRPGFGYLTHDIEVPEDDLPHHLAVTCTTDGVWTTYLDGLAVGMSAPGSFTAPSDELWLGYSASSERLTSGIDIDNAGWFNSELSPKKIQKHAGFSSATPLGWWDGSSLKPL